MRLAILLMSGVFLFSCKRHLTSSQPAFASGEHLYIGETAFDLACRQARLPCERSTQIPRNDAQEAFSYGELVAFAGDFYASPENMWLETNNFTRVIGNNVDKNKELFRNELATIALLEKSVKAGYPSNDLAYLVNFPNYLKLAIDNDIHFGFNNMVGYVQVHGKALNLALEAFKLKTQQSADAEKLWNQALFFNSYADHLLSDAFAAGHIRVPRTQIKKWAKNKKYPDVVAGTFSKILHDRDGKLPDPQGKGLAVRNARGDQWETRVDMELYWNNGASRDAPDKVVEAVRLSLEELMSVYTTGAMPGGAYAAAMLAPFPDVERERPFSDRFSKLPDSEVKAILEEGKWFAKVPVFGAFGEVLLKDFLSAIPSIMKDFRSDVAAAIAADGALRERLPSAYLDGFSTIN